jgi:hypothetical protein
MLLDRDPVVGLDLASQPTLSRFENSVGPRQLYRLGESLAESVIARHAKRLGGHARRVTIDLDPADDPTHGAQQLSFFNSHYDNACYLPMMGFVTFSDEADQYLCAAVLRPGNVTAAAGAVGILRRLMALIRGSFPKARIRVRLDGGFANPELLAFLDGAPGVEYVVAMASNAVLERKAAEAMQVARLLAGLTDQTEHVYGETSYAAGTWNRERRVIIKAEVARADDKAPKDNPRFRANQFRVLLTAAAYALMQELRLQAALTDCARAQVWTLRERFLKLGARVMVWMRRLVVHLPQSFPFLAAFRQIAMGLGASMG